jgi:HTH-type transcriptional regulator / antitoxin HigA
MERQVRTVTGQRRAPARERHEYAPDSVLPPGETLRETLEALPMSQAELSTRTGLSTKHINQIVQGVAVLSHDTAIALERATGVPARLWNSLEANYRDYLARKRERDELADQTAWLGQIPVKALRKMGIVTADPDDEPGILQQVLRFFGVISIAAWESVWRKPGAHFRQSPAFGIDPGALATWLRLGELEAQRLHCAPYDREALRQHVPRLRALTIEPLERFLPEMKRLCSQAGVAVVIIPEITGCRASGATRWLSPHKAVLQLSVRHKRNDHLWFSFFHELGHILLHGKRDQFIEDDSPPADPKEQEADRFAADTLIPPQHATELSSLKSLTAITEFARRTGVAPGIVVGRLQHEGIIGFNVGHKLFERYRFAEKD